MDPRKWGQRPHTYLSSFLEGGIAKFKGYDECHLKGWWGFRLLLSLNEGATNGKRRVWYKAREES